MDTKQQELIQKCMLGPRLALENTARVMLGEAWSRGEWERALDMVKILGHCNTSRRRLTYSGILEAEIEQEIAERTEGEGA